MQIDANKKATGPIDYTGSKGDLDLTADDITLTGAVAITGDTAITGDLTVTGDFGFTALETVSDPGDAGTITPPTSGANFSCTLTSGTSGETRVMGTPTRLGQIAVIILGTDGGGNVLITNDDGWDDGGTSDDVATFDDAADALIAIAIATGAATDWRKVNVKGVTIA